MSQAILITAKTTRTRLGVSNVTLWRWRKDGSGPRWCKMGARIMYDLHSVNEYIEQRLREHSDATTFVGSAA